jgi:sugar phosphate isomerase/epimerase
MQNIELIAAYWTIAGSAVPGSGREYSLFDFKDRVEQAANAGFKGLGLWHEDLLHTRKSRSLKEMRSILDDHGMKYLELDWLDDWFLESGERRSASDQRRRMFLEAADALGVWHIKVGDAQRTPCPKNKLIEEFAQLCDEAARHGTRIVYEIMPFSMIDSLEAARELVQGAGAPNGGVLFDLWHMTKLAIPHEKIWQFPQQYFFGVEISDGYVRNAPTQNLMEETVFHRRLCGEGEFDVKGFLSHLPESHYRGPVGVEICSDQLRSWPLQKACERTYQTALAQFPA